MNPTCLAEAPWEESTMTNIPIEDLTEKVLDSCKRIASVQEIVAACLYGSRVCGYADYKSDIEVFLVLNKSPSKIESYLKLLDGSNIFFLVTNRETFERDVNKGGLGEFLAEKIMYPYKPILNEEYLRRQEVKVKKRIICQILENLVLEYPELSYELFIKVEYFMYEAMRRRARLFPHVTYGYLNMLRQNLKKKNVNSMMEGYIKALDELSKENLISVSNEYIVITPNFIKTIKSKKPRIPVFLKSFQRIDTRAIFRLFKLFPRIAFSLIREKDLFTKAHQGTEAKAPVLELEDPKRCLLVSTSIGFATISEKTKIEDFVKKTAPNENLSSIKTEELGGVFNDVYLLTFKKNHQRQRVVVKKFRDWHGFKWFPLALWALGAQTFAVLGQSRMEREYSINQFLHEHGLHVPKVLYVSPKERLIFEDYVEGENLVEIVKRIVSLKGRAVKEATIIKEIGRKMAEVHKLGVVLGDCKPENIIVTKDEKIFFVDLEQATRNDNQAWDIAEFIYYSGHYVSPLSYTDAADLIAKNLIGGYLESGGKKGTVRKAATARYTKVFSIFTSPHVILSVSDICKRMGKDENLDGSISA